MDCGRTETQYIQMAAADLIQTPPRFISLDNTVMGRSNTIRYDTRCYFNVRSKADIIKSA